MIKYTPLDLYCVHSVVRHRTPPQVSALMSEVKGVHARLGTLSEFNYRMSEEDIRLSWRTMDYPTVSIGLTDIIRFFFLDASVH